MFVNTVAASWRSDKTIRDELWFFLPPCTTCNLKSTTLGPGIITNLFFWYRIVYWGMAHFLKIQKLQLHKCSIFYAQLLWATAYKTNITHTRRHSKRQHTHKKLFSRQGRRISGIQGRRKVWKFGGASMIFPLGWNRVNWSAKIGGRGIAPSAFRTTVLILNHLQSV